MSSGKWHKKYDSLDDLLEDLEQILTHEEFVYVQQFLAIIDNMRSKVLDVMVNNLRRYGYLYYKSEETGQWVFAEDYYEIHILPTYEQLVIKILQWFVRHKKWNEDQSLIDRMLIKSAINHSNTLMKELGRVKCVETFPERDDDDDDEFDERPERDPYLVYNKRGELDRREWVHPGEAISAKIDIDEYLTCLTPSERRVIELKHGIKTIPEDIWYLISKYGYQGLNHDVYAAEYLGISLGYYRKVACNALKKLEKAAGVIK